MLIPPRTIVLFRPASPELQARLRTDVLKAPSREAFIVGAWQRLLALETAAGRGPLLLVERPNSLTGLHGLIVCDAYGNPFGELLSEPVGELDEGAKNCANWLAQWAKQRELWLLIHSRPALAFAIVFEGTDRRSWRYVLRLLFRDEETMQWTEVEISH